MTENEAWELYKKRKKARLKGRGLRKDADGNWITIKGTHVQIGDDGEITGKVADKIKASSNNRKAKKFETSDSLKPQNTDYDYDPKDDLQGFIHKNVSKTKPIYKEHGMEGVEDEWFKTRMQNCTKDFKRISDDEIDDILENNINYGTARLWLLEYDHEVKPALAMQLTMNPEVHNAALNIMYKNYESYMKHVKHEEPLPFEEFLVTPIKMYRGGSGKEYETASVFSSYTFSDEVAKKFKTNPTGHSRPDAPGVVYEAEIRPIDTYGSLNTSGEMEIFVPKFVAPNGKYDSAEFNTDADDDDGRWITTENGHHVHLNEEGEPDKGNKHVIEAMEGKTDTVNASVEKYGKTHAERHKKRMALKNACQEGLRGYRPVLRSKREILEAKRSYVREFDKVQKELSVLEDVTKENLEAKKKEFDRLIEEADKKEFEAEEATYDWTSKEDKRRLEHDYEAAKYRAVEARRNRRLLNDFEFNKERLESIKENRKSYDLEYESAVKEYNDAKAHMEGIVDRYNRQIDEMDRAILAKYPDYDSIKSADDVSEYLTAKGYFRVSDKESRMRDIVSGEPKDGTAKFDGCDLTVAKSMCKLCDSLYERFPEMKGKIGGIYLNASEDAGGSVTSLYDGISLNKEMFGQVDGFDDFYSGTFHPTIKGTSKNQKHAAVLSHEFGHMLDFYLADDQHNEIGDYVTYYDPETGMSREVFSVGPAILRKAAHNLGIAKADLKKRISSYACKNDVEALAEAFSEFIASDEPRPEAKEIGRQIVALYNTGKLAGKEKEK